MSAGKNTNGVDLRAIREERGETLQEVADRIGIRRQTLSEWERRNVVLQDLDLALKIAADYGVPVEALAREARLTAHA